MGTVSKGYTCCRLDLFPAYGNSDVWKPNQHNFAIKKKKFVGLEDVEIAQIYFDR